MKRNTSLITMRHLSGCDENIHNTIFFISRCCVHSNNGFNTRTDVIVVAADPNNRTMHNGFLLLILQQNRVLTQSNMKKESM